MVGIAWRGWMAKKLAVGDLQEAISLANPYRLFAIAAAMRQGIGLQQIFAWSKIDMWFLTQIQRIVAGEDIIARTPWPFSAELLREWKTMGFSDARIAGLCGRRKSRCGTCAENSGFIRAPADRHPGREYAAQTNYLYLSYDALEETRRSAATSRAFSFSARESTGSAAASSSTGAASIPSKRPGILGYETILLIITLKPYPPISMSATG